MRLSATVVFAAFALAACTDAPVGPRQPLGDAPTLQLSHLGASPDTADLCGGLSPCDAFNYRNDTLSVGAPGICFLPPTVDNHLSDPACSAPNRSGLSGIFKLAWCRVSYADSTGATPPTIGECQDPADWKPFLEESGHYATSVQWKRSEAKVGDMFRLYVVRGNQMFAHRDVVVDPNLTTPADSYVHAIGFGNEPVKIRINDDFACIKYDTQDGTPQNAATCLIAGATTIDFETNELDLLFVFPDGNAPFLADFEVSECLSLGFNYDAGTGLLSGNALVDTPLADCKLSLSSDELVRLDYPAELFVTFTDERWDVGGPFANARLNVLEYDELGLGALPHTEPQTWYGEVTSNNTALRWLGRGLDRLAALILPEKVYAAAGAGFAVSRMSDLQVAVMPIMQPASDGAACASGDDFCIDLGAFPVGGTPTVSVRVSAPPASANPDTATYFDVPDTRLHFFPQTGSMSCPTGSEQGADGRGCVAPLEDDNSTSPPSKWGHFVYVTGSDGLGNMDWHLADGQNVLRVAACGVARPGDNEPDALGGDNVWGDLDPAGCTDRETSMTAPGAYDNGPADGLSPFEPVDTENEAAVYGLPLVFLASTCPQITIDGVKSGNEWAACADSLIFTAPQKGPKVSDNAKLFTYSDGDALYIGIEVASTELGNKMFIQLAETVLGGDGVEAAGDEILVLDQLGVVPGGLFEDWHDTQSCVGNNGSSLCGQIDVVPDSARVASARATLNGAGTGRVFYEFKRPLHSPGATSSPKEDLGAGSGSTIGIRGVLTQGQGGGKGGWVFPDPQTSTKKYYLFGLE